jgi:hypothetical protein
VSEAELAKILEYVPDTEAVTDMYPAKRRRLIVHGEFPPKESKPRRRGRKEES